MTNLVFYLFAYHKKATPQYHYIICPRVYCHHWQNLLLIHNSPILLMKSSRLSDLSEIVLTTTPICGSSCLYMVISIKSCLLGGVSFGQIQKAIKVWGRWLIIKTLIWGLLLGCILGYAIRHRQTNPYIHELEGDRALLTQLQREKARAEMVEKAIMHNAVKRKKK